MIGEVGSHDRRWIPHSGRSGGKYHHYYCKTTPSFARVHGPYIIYITILRKLINIASMRFYHDIFVNKEKKNTVCYCEK